MAAVFKYCVFYLITLLWYWYIFIKYILNVYYVYTMCMISYREHCALLVLLNIIRQGSGSACRSMYGGFVEWVAGSRDDGTDSIAQQIATEHHWPNLHVLILVVLYYIFCVKCYLPWILVSVTIIVSKSKSRFLKNRGRLKSRYFSCGNDFFYEFNAFHEQRLNCVFSIHAIRTAHDYFIIVTHTLHLSAKKHIFMCFSDKRLLLFTAIVTATIFVYKWTRRFMYCSVVQWSKILRKNWH